MEVNEERENLQIALVNLAKALYEYIRKYVEEFVNKMWSVIKESLPKVVDEYFKRQKQIAKTRSSWSVPADTRIKSQVINKKPKYVVRKVIR